MRIALGSDHGGFQLKEEIKSWFDEKQVSYQDYGTHSTELVDYPDYAVPVAKDVSQKNADFGILICRTGIGMSITANKVPHVRAALCDNAEHARLSRLHNDANVLTLAGDTPVSAAKEIINTFLSTCFDNKDRHKRRVNKIHTLTGI